MKVQVIGNSEAVLGFALTGVHGEAVFTAEEANQALDTAMAASDIGIILVTEDIARLIEPRMDSLKLHSTVPLVVEIPGPQGMPAGKPSLGEIVLRAIGVKI